ncbi:hypothetical protein P154DRAFT_525242 [Amniculicola lignicola CBS 123094]|uniref:F-box domain-containing protein n=1 Tax=Amniculicola lignicola CBS 123094 TaxID=1392246 RepID=A0A6A5WGL8_9PLEO|nr:hypothetical protein P154DRAFT_525242 [Amniculicola lignicola CBS 123094]
MAYLPDELMHEIFQYLECDRPTLLAIAKTSRRFHCIVQPISFRHIEFSGPSYLRSRDSEDYQEESKALFDRTLKENGWLRKCVRSIGPMMFNDSALRHELQQLQSYPKLEGIIAKNRESLWCPYSTKTLNPVFTKSPFINRLKWMTLIDPPEGIFRSQLNSLQHLRVQDLNYAQMTTWDQYPGFPSITSFDLYGVQRVLSHTDLSRILGLFPGLLHLRVNARLGVSRNNSVRNPEWIFEGTGIIQALWQQHTSLEVLELLITKTTPIIVNSRVPLQFAVFEKLKYLKTNAMCLFNMVEPQHTRIDPSDHNWEHVFPRTLERLEIIFPRTMRTFYCSTENIVSTGHRSKVCLVSPSQSRWLHLFPALKGRVLHNLRSVCLTECDDEQGENRNTGESGTASELWDPRDAITKAYLEADLVLSIRI